MAIFSLDSIMQAQGINVNKLSIASGVPYNTLKRIVRNSVTAIHLDILEAILDALCRLTGHCYDVNDIIKVHYPTTNKEQESHVSLRDEACDSVVSGELL